MSFPVKREIDIASNLVEVKGNDGISAYINFDIMIGTKGGRNQLIGSPSIPGYCSAFLRECKIEEKNGYFYINEELPFKGKYLEKIFKFCNSFGLEDMPIITGIEELTNLRKLLPPDIFEILCSENPKPEELADIIILNSLANYLGIGDAIHLLTFWIAHISDNICLLMNKDNYRDKVIVALKANK